MKEAIISSLKQARDCLDLFLSKQENINKVEAIINSLVKCFKTNKKVIIFGNGGSCADASHFAEELVGRFKKDRPSLPAIALNDGSYLTCVANDYGFEQVFKRSIESLGNENDVIIGISTSGNSINVKNALDYAKQNNMISIALLGKDGGCMTGKYDMEICIDNQETERIQELHMLLLHIIIDQLENKLFN